MDADEELVLRNAGFWPALGATALWCRHDAMGEYQQLLRNKGGTWTASIYASGACARDMPTATAALMAAELSNWGR